MMQNSDNPYLAVSIGTLAYLLYPAQVLSSRQCQCPTTDI